MFHLSATLTIADVVAMSMPPDTRSLLIAACSQRKRTGPALLPAIERYDGPVYRLLRRYIKEQSQAAKDVPDIYILSAKFGLMPSSQLIPAYDQRMTAQRARDLQPSILFKFQCLLDRGHYQQLTICAGRNYLHLLGGHSVINRSELEVQIITGGLGKQLSQLHDQLYGRSPKSGEFPLSLPRRGQARIHGVEIVLTPEQVLEVVRRALIKGEGNPGKFHSWYVSVDGQRVAPKWIISQVTGLPVSAFVTDEARRVLAQLDIRVERI